MAPKSVAGLPNRASDTHYAICPEHCDSLVCNGKILSGARCKKTVNAIPEPGFAPVCRAHKDQQIVEGVCKAIEKCGKAYLRSFALRPGGYPVCDRHQGERESGSCYFDMLPKELRLEIFRYLAPQPSVEWERWIKKASNRYIEPATKRTYSALMRINSSLAAEAAIVLYGQTPFNIDITSSGISICGILWEPLLGTCTLSELGRQFSAIPLQKIRNFRIWIRIEQFEGEEKLNFIRDQLHVLVDLLVTIPKVLSLEVTINANFPIWTTEVVVATAQSILGSFGRLRGISRPRLFNVIKSDWVNPTGFLSRDILTWSIGQSLEIGSESHRQFDTVKFQRSEDFKGFQTLFAGLLSKDGPHRPKPPIWERYQRVLGVIKVLGNPTINSCQEDLLNLQLTARMARDLHDSRILDQIMHSLEQGYRVCRRAEAKRDADLTREFQVDKGVIQPSDLPAQVGTTDDSFPQVRYRVLRYRTMSELGLNMGRFWLTLDGFAIFCPEPKDESRSDPKASLEKVFAMRYSPDFVSVFYVDLIRPLIDRKASQFPIDA